MEQSSENENICDVFMNEVKIEDEIWSKLEEMVGLQTKGRKNA